MSQRVPLGRLLLLGALICSCGATNRSLVAPSPDVAPTIVRVRPTTGGPVGAEVVVEGSGFAATNNTVKFGVGYIKSLESADGTTLRFTIPAGLDLCPPEPSDRCLGAEPRVMPGEYAVAVIVSGKTSNTLTFVVAPP